MAYDYIDSHAHLADQAFDGDRDAVIARARAAGATAVVCIGASVADARGAQAVAAAHPGFVFFTAGVHPHEAATFDAAPDLGVLRDLAASGAVAIGECGLDYHYDHSPRAEQRAAFAAQIALAAELALPLVVHSRDAEEDSITMIAEAGQGGVRGVLHCCTGPARLARAAVDAGWYVSFSGIATFKRWSEDDAIRLVPDDRLLVESDSPYLAPVPHRGSRNEPAWVPHTIERLAAVRRTTAPSFAALTAANARHLFGLAHPSPSV